MNTILSILFSKKGIHGTRDIFEGQYGFFKAFEADVDRRVLINELGSDYYGKKSSIKLYPSSRATHAGIDAAIEILEENQFNISEIARVDINMFDFCYNIVGAPIEEKQNPKSCEQAKFSYPFCVASALSGNSMLNLLDEAMVQDATIRNLSKKVNTQVDKALKKFQARVEVELTSGKTFQKEIFKCKGHPDNPLEYNDIKSKFMECAKYAKEHNFEIPDSISHFLFEYIGDLENRTDVQNINKHLR